MSVHGLPSYLLAECLGAESNKGPTLPLSHLASLSWMQRQLGFSFALSSMLLHPFRAVPGLHEVKQQIQYDLKEHIHWETLLKSGNPYVQNVALAYLSVTYST
eukprot:11095142-Karenia_brevis.AAC.1